jgi:hypothetical protein
VCKTAQGEDKQEQTQEKVRGPYMRLGNTMLARSSEHPSVRACCVHVWLRSVLRVLRVGCVARAVCLFVCGCCRLCLRVLHTLTSARNRQAAASDWVSSALLLGSESLGESALSGIPQA